MKIVTKVEHILEDGDKTLIFSKLPEDPCKKCDMGIACCGCPNGAKYQERIRPYKEHNVLELAQKTNEYYKLYKEIEQATLSMSKLDGEFREMGLNIKYIVDVMEGR